MVLRIAAIASLALLIVVAARFHDPAATEDVAVMPLAIAKTAGFFGREG